MIESLDLSTIDPGVRDLVAMLNANGFETTDSGDGKTKPANERSFGETAHVVIESNPDDIIDYSYKLKDVLESMGYPVHQGSIQASFDPTNEVAIIIYLVLDSDMLADDCLEDSCPSL